MRLLDLFIFRRIRCSTNAVEVGSSKRQPFNASASPLNRWLKGADNDHSRTSSARSSNAQIFSPRTGRGLTQQIEVQAIARSVGVSDSDYFFTSVSSFA